MAEKLSPATDCLTATLDHWQDWHAEITERPTLARKLKGKSNDNYLVTASAQQFVVRANSDNLALGVNRRLEAEVLRDIASQSYSPVVVWETDASLVTRFIEGEHPAPSQPGEWLVRMGQLFAAIHGTPTHVTEYLDPLRHAIDYFEQLDNPDPAVSACMEQLLNRRPVPPAVPCLCHNDLLFENVIRTDETFYAIDWEYSRSGDPAFDLTVFLEGTDMSDANARILLDAYDNPSIVKRIDDYRDLYRLIEILWWELRSPDLPENKLRIASLAAGLRQR